MAEQELAQWYVVHTYSSYENKVKANLEKAVENRGLQDLILEVRIPTEDVVEIKDNKRKLRQAKIYPGYVLVKMVMTDEAWYVVRNTRGVTGFVGSGTKPIPLTEAEVEHMGMERQPVRIDMAVGDEVRIVEGPLENFTGKLEEIVEDRQKVHVMVSMFGRDTLIELDFGQIRKLG